jgi:hypothetical protein
MNPLHPESLPRRIVRDLEIPIIYGLMILASAIALLVWGATLIGPHGGSLLQGGQPVFGTYYGMGMQAFLLVILLSNRRWLGIGILIAGFSAHSLVVWVSPRARPITVDEFWGLSPIFPLAAICCLVYHHYDLWDGR